MKEIHRKLIARLYKKGLNPIEIPRLIKDVSRIVENNPDNSHLKLNRRLNSLGWRKDLIDDFTFELIVYLLENTRPASSAENLEFSQ